ncbi:hypothetical protein [Thalassomonas actiniarum]|uniref:Uncharacterized protein n=1 Tax=Thalassomonas actiniarum TaxID=485447 RepID=A0AAE9YNR7_9GAMM|nr:hypothetical protein [Thalassomonas actiniarum]WDD97428.1 hypothetical protein SG35_019180 [Thalassomonas actiniarum]
MKFLITLDHRRVALPSRDEQKLFGSCVVKIADARHNDMSDAGPDWLKQKIQYIVSQYLNKTASCNKLQQV